ncbi:hypothetical protein EGW08_018597 [Elysia chlorotica]|uniref:Ig-like domain-containing protein n=1 Tax=Elysia chlorotica TaxID=188477 RepID=A0A3S0ZRL0_ELYCH|nr:hypothetical protein EGW08_018597 [Elysia chlorotica]
METTSSQTKQENKETKPTMSKVNEELATIEDFFSDENENDDETDYNGGGDTSREKASLSNQDQVLPKNDSIQTGEYYSLQLFPLSWISMDLLAIALLLITSAVPIAALRISTEGSSSIVVEHATDLLLKCYAMFHNSDDELTSVTWYEVAPPTSVSREIFTLDATREQPAYYFSGKWAGRGMFQPMGEGVVGVTIVLPARFVSRTDAGNYRCQLRSMMTSGFGDVTVSVHYPPGTTLTLSPAGLVQRQEGAELTLTCTAQCSPHCGYRWYKAGRTISSTPIVHIPAVSRDDAGLYACQADNLAGSSIKPVDVRVRFSTAVVDVSLSTLPYNPVSVHNAPMMEQPRTSSFAALGEADETSAPISKSNTGDSLWQFTVTLVCNVTGWPDPVIKWVSPQTTFKDRTIIESDTPEVQVSNHPWSLSKKSGVGVIRNATCLDNGLYTCFGLNGDSLSKETRPPFFSNRSVLLDLPCPPVDPHSEMVAPMLSLEGKSTKIDGNVKASEFENGSVSLTLCKSTTTNIETDGEFEVIVAELDKTITIIACFVSNPKPSLELRYLDDDRAKTRSDFLRKEGFSLVHRKHVLKENVLNTLKVQPILDGADKPKLRHSGSENNYDSSREISQNLNNIGFGEERLNRGKPRFNEEVKNGVDEITLDQLSVPSFNIGVANTIHIVKPLTLECSRKSSASLCVVEVNITITDPIQYGRYELAAKNSHGVSRKKYRVVSRQAPLAPSHFRLEKVSSDSACFSWKAHFDGGAKQSFHLCFRKESETLASATNSQLFKDQIGVESNCKQVVIKSHDLPLISDRGDKHVRSGSDDKNVYSHCQSSLIPSTHYNVTLFSSNKYGKSKVPTTIAFQTNPKRNNELSFWSTTEPIISKVLEPASSTTHDTVERTSPDATSNPTTEILLLTSHLPPTEMPSFEDDIEIDSENSTINLESNQPELSQEDIFSDQDIEKNAKEAHKSSAENEKEDEEDFLDELLFDEDDLIYGEINDVPFFQLFGVNPPLNAEHNNGHTLQIPHREPFVAHVKQNY